jgi:tRNA pseudouridine synthase 10
MTLRRFTSLEVIEKATALLDRYPLCDHCLGRQFSMLGHGFTNGERGQAIKRLLVLEGSRLLWDKDEAGEPLLRRVAVHGFSAIALATLHAFGVEVEEGAASCYLCGNAFLSLDEFCDKVVASLSPYEYDSFLVGVKVEDWVEDREDELRARDKVRWGESIRSDFSREIGKRVMKATGREVAFKRPDILITVNPLTGTIGLKVNSLFIYGRYRKLIRGIPQAKWICRQCGGQGCDACHHTGKLYPESVEELIAQPLLQATAGTDVKIHAAGREDIDARVLGSGRPFIIEVVNPEKRRIQLRRLEEEINRASEGKIEVDQLEFTSKDRVRRLKAGEGAEKIYRATVEFEEAVVDDAVSRLEETMTQTVIRQKTPTRVLHRRADKVRKRRIFTLEATRVNPTRIELVVHCEGGLYIKEFISGDAGRTSPSVSEATKSPARCVDLDVLKVYVEEFQ